MSSTGHHKPFFRRTGVEDEVNAELAFHFAMTIHELTEAGMKHDDARAEAARRFGSVEDVTARCEALGRERDTHASRVLFRSELEQDVTFAVRQLARARSFSSVAMLTLALGIGATAAVFSALYAVVLHPLPFAQPERVVVLETTNAGEISGLSPAEFGAVRDHAAGFDRVAAAVLQGSATLTDGDVPEVVASGRVTHDYFAVLGLNAALGRTFDATSDTPGNEHVAILSHRFWMSHKNGDKGIAGRSMHINGEEYTIIGVMPESLDLTADTEDIWTPLVITAETERTGGHYLSGIGRLKPGISIAQARGQATGAVRDLVTRVGDRARPITDTAMDVTPYVDKLVGDYRHLLLILLGAVSFVLLIACTNVANLLLSRATSRSRELAVRAALGAGRARLVRQLLTESVVLGLGGALLGLVVAFGILAGVHAFGPTGVPRLERATIDWHVLAVTLVIALACSIVFGLVPALRAAGPSLESTLRDAGRGSSGGAGSDRLRSALVAAEVAMSITLLIGSGLLIRSAWLTQHVDPGFDAHGVLTSRIALPKAQYAEADVITRTFERIRDDAAHIPGVEGAALSVVVPLSGSRLRSPVHISGKAGPENSHSANFRVVSPGYFAVMKIARREGRDFDTRDDAAAPKVMLVNETLARTLWPGVRLRDIIGQRIETISQTQNSVDPREVVGIVADLHDAALTKPSEPEFYLPVPQTPPVMWRFFGRSLVVLLRASNTSVSAATLKKPLQHVVAEVDRSLPLADARTMDDYVRSSLEAARFNTILLSTLGAIALALAMVGVYGVVSYFVTQRTQEIGIRMALGATPAHIWTHVVRHALSPVGVGVVLGLLLYYFTASVLRSQLYGVAPTDPRTFGSVGLLLMIVSLVATYVPARRAMRVEPVVALSAS